MANQLKMAEVQAILALWAKGWSRRRIARELGMDRETVGRHLRLWHAANPGKALTGSGWGEGGSKPASVLGGCATDVTAVNADPQASSAALAETERAEKVAGFGKALIGSADDASGSKPASAAIGADDPKPASAPPGSEEGLARLSDEPVGSNPASVPVGYHADVDSSNLGSGSLGSARSPGDSTDPIGQVRTSAVRRGTPSQCEPMRQAILAKLELGLTAQRIHQDLLGEGHACSYHSVRRFIKRLRRVHELPYRRMECAPGEECQVDFGSGAWIQKPDGRRRRSHVLRVVLSFSRKGYSEAVWRQSTDDFIRALENAFWAWGGVTRIVTIDNLRAAVKHPDWYDPELNPKIESFCRHYGISLLPAKPYTPRHKGKVKRGVSYVKDNGLKGHSFSALQAENDHLQNWEATGADKRIHGTTRQQVGQKSLSRLRC
jgi:transposase